jgi:hypothetical protein
MTGNGLFINPNVAHPPRNYADSLVKLDANLNLVGSFTPSNYPFLAVNDTDFGSGGPIVIPDKADKGKKEVIGCGKEAMVYLVDRKAMIPAKLHQTGNQLSRLALVTSPQAQSTPAALAREFGVVLRTIAVNSETLSTTAAITVHFKLSV